jgi:drug/metabolite transporter (DMT)-like permease
VITVVLGLASALLYALHDLLTQRLSRAHGLILVLCWIIPVGAVIVVPLALATDGLPATPAEWGAVAYSASAGVFYLATWFTIVRALQIGDLSLVAPLASLEGLFIAVYAIVRGTDMAALTGVGIGLAVIGGTLAAMQGRARSAAGAGWALLTSVLWTLTVICFDRAGEISWLSQAAWSRVTTLVLFAPVAIVVLGRSAAARRGYRAARRSVAASSPPAVRESPTAGRPAVMGWPTRALCVGSGLLEMGAFAAMTLAVQRGPLAVAGVTIAQYATAAVILGLVFLKERPRRHQIAGVACTVVAVSILGAVG